MIRRESPDDILSKYWDKKLPVDILKICRDMEIDVFYHDGKSKLVVTNAYKPIIWLNENHGVRLQRITLAKLLGQFINE